jgi:hypothetical protein
VFGWLQADTVAAVWTAAAAIHREKNTVEAAAGLQPQQAAANKLQIPKSSCSSNCKLLSTIQNRTNKVINKKPSISKKKESNNTNFDTSSQRKLFFLFFCRKQKKKRIGTRANELAIRTRSVQTAGLACRDKPDRDVIVAGPAEAPATKQSPPSSPAGSRLLLGSRSGCPASTTDCSPRRCSHLLRRI